MIYAHVCYSIAAAKFEATDYVRRHREDVEKAIYRTGTLPMVVKMKNGDEHHFTTAKGYMLWSRGRGEHRRIDE